MTNILIILEIFFTVVMGLYFMNALKQQKSTKIVIEKENKKEVEKLRKLNSIKLTEPLTEKSRPISFGDIIGQEMGIKALKAAICGPNPQHIIIYGPPGVGKTAAARLVLDAAKKNKVSPFKNNAKFIEIDGTTVRCDDRGIADPLIGSVHDPIYQGAGPLGIAGIPQPKLGAVTKAHGGILFIDEIGELHPIEINKLLKVLEDRKVYFESAYYNNDNPNIPNYIKDIFDNGLPADFRLIGATTKSPEEITPALRSRCIEIFFRGLLPEELEKIGMKAAEKVKIKLDDEGKKLIGKYADNGRDAVNIVQLAYGIAMNENRSFISREDVQWVIDNGQYTPKLERFLRESSEIGLVNGLAVYGPNLGTLLEIEVAASKCTKGKGQIKITGIIEEEFIQSKNRKVSRKSTIKGSVENVITVLNNEFSIDTKDYNIHIDFPGGTPVDGTSAGITIATAIYSAIVKRPVDNTIAMTGELTIYGKVKAIGGINAKISAAKKAGIKKVIVPMENMKMGITNCDDIEIIPIENIREAIEISIIKVNKEGKIYPSKEENDILSAKILR
ncbi:MAG TPA: ATP-dependent protease LonB [Clostridiaceae bacterium]